jgi:maltooligosyltrehalose trehalohydrolase
VWAPSVERVAVRAEGRPDTPLLRIQGGYHQGEVEGVAAGTRYRYVLDGQRERPDPASRFQPEGVHGPSEIVPRDFAWTDQSWRGLPLERHIIYELHVGTFTDEGTFDAAIDHLPGLRDLGITALELMPVAQFPGSRNWGYDGVGLFAAQNSYGGPRGLKRLVDAAHRHGLAVLLDVVYNHLGPEGNYLGDFGPYFTDRYKTPWGPALNFDGAESDAVRRFFIENALYWVTDCHIDGLRLDAVHAIVDPSPRPFVAELIEAVHRRATELNRAVHIIAESASNDARLLRPPELGGLGADAQWNDDFHHALRTLITGERGGYYQSYGRLSQLAKAFREGFVYTGEYSPFHQRRHGTPTTGIPPRRFVVFSQNHDQVGNRMLGERLAETAPFEALKLAAGAVLLSPFLPLLFMGEEYGERAPFLYFVSHGDPGLIDAVRRGREDEFAGFGWSGEPPDPQDAATFARSRLNRGLAREPLHATLLEFHRTLLRMRRDHPALGGREPVGVAVEHDQRERMLLVRRWSGEDELAVAMHFAPAPGPTVLRLPPGEWRLALDSAHGRWGGPGSLLPERMASDGHADVEMPPWSLAVYERSGGGEA